MWGSELVGQIPTFQFDEIMTDDVKLLNLLEDLRDIGLTLTKGVPAETGHLAKFVDRISYLKVTNFGSVHTIKSKTSPNNLAFSGLKLGFHTDLNHYHYKPNITVFHCIQQSKTGGESMFADGFKTALQLKEEDPDAFKTLCDTYCDYIHKGRRGTVDSCTKCARPTFSFDRYGNIDGVHFDQTSRDIRLHIPVEKVYPYYKAIKDYYDLINRPENRVNFRMQPGDIVMLENTRILHGRNAFTVTEGAERHLESVFMDWDGVYSKIRCLREKLGMSFHDY
ncbi:gamma-butyrobetaine dioxygenase-like [Ptychodera flava]|uniref:gamma-butyrobetaine dioxygenase-like n=1 Tax=Ptychodera flava TaxID=63121 RepID=UPI00396A6102